MKTMFKTVLVVALLVAALGSMGVSGCAGDSTLAVEAAQSATQNAGMEGYRARGDAKRVSMEDSQSHQMIAKMRFLEYDMSPNLDDYRNVYLVEMADDSGHTITAVCYSKGGEVLSLLPKDTSAGQ